MYNITEIYNILLSREYYRTLFNITSNNSNNSDISILCPFHNEKTPSFSISIDKPFYHCFGCGEQGDWLAFLQKINGWDFKEALEFLASEANVSKTPYTGEKNKIIETKSFAKEEFIFTKEIISENEKYYFKCYENINKDFPSLYQYFEDKRHIKRDIIEFFNPIGVDLEKKEWIIPILSIFHVNSDNIPQFIGWERRKYDFTPYKWDGKEAKCLKSANTTTLATITGSIPDKNSNVVILEGFMDAYMYVQYIYEQDKPLPCILTPSNGINTLPKLLEKIDLKMCKNVQFILDNDNAGTEMTEKLNKIYPEFNYMILPKDVNGNKVKDFTDYYLGLKKEKV